MQANAENIRQVAITVRLRQARIKWYAIGFPTPLVMTGAESMKPKDDQKQ